MKASLLYKFLSGDINTQQLKIEIDEEIAAFRVKLKLHKKGGSLPISIEDDLEFTFKSEYLLKLCDHYLNEELDNVEFEYIADCIILREPDDYENEELVDLLESMTDPKVNGVITKERIARIKNDFIFFS